MSENDTPESTQPPETPETEAQPTQDEPVSEGVETDRAAQDEQDQPGLAEREQQRIEQAAAAKIADDLEAHRVGEIGERLIFRDQAAEPERGDEEGEVEIEERRIGALAVEAPCKAEKQVEEQRLGGEQCGCKCDDLDRRIERARLTEAAADNPIFAFGQQ